MGSWKDLFAKRAGALTWRALGPKCPFCGRRTAERDSTVTRYPLWESECGAVGSGSPMYPDLDDVADGLLVILGIGGRVSEPDIPISESGLISMQRYDIPKSIDQLWQILRGRGFEMQQSTFRLAGQTTHSIWVRRHVA